MRHGQTNVNVAARVHSKSDEATLDRVGESQAHKLAIACFQEKIEQLFCSPEIRAQQTAGIIASELGLKPVVLSELSERNWGNWSGRPWTEIQRELEHMNLIQRYEFVPPNGESWKSMEERLRIGIDKIIQADVPAVGVVTHGGALRAIVPILTAQPKETSFQYDFKNASVTSFNYDDGNWALLRENYVSHLVEEK